MTRINEAEMADVVEKILKRRPDKSATYEELREIVPKHVKLSRADCAELPSRPGEQMWVQQVRNLVAHKREGFERVPGGVCLEGHAPKPKPKAKAAAKSKSKAKAKATGKVRKPDRSSPEGLRAAA